MRFGTQPHEREWIPELARRFVNLVQNARERRRNAELFQRALSVT